MTMKAFISHSSIDKPFVERLATDLRTREGIDATNVAQVQKAKDVIKYASQREGDSLSGLLDSIYQAAPHLKR